MAYVNSDDTLGVPDVSSVIATGSIGDPSGITELPSAQMAPKLGSIMKAQDVGNAWEGEFIFLAVPVSTTVTAGLLYQYDKNYNVVLVPIGSTSKNTGVSVVVAYTGVTSNATLVQYAWFLIRGQVPVLKTAVASSPQTGIYMSATAGRVYFTASAGKQILGARTQNATTVTSTTSTVNVYFNYSSIEGT